MFISNPALANPSGMPGIALRPGPVVLLHRLSPLILSGLNCDCGMDMLAYMYTVLG